MKLRLIGLYILLMGNVGFSANDTLIIKIRGGEFTEYTGEFNRLMDLGVDSIFLYYQNKTVPFIKIDSSSFMFVFVELDTSVCLKAWIETNGGHYFPFELSPYWISGRTITLEIRVSKKKYAGFQKKKYWIVLSIGSVGYSGQTVRSNSLRLTDFKNVHFNMCY